MSAIPAAETMSASGRIGNRVRTILCVLIACPMLVTSVSAAEVLKPVRLAVLPPVNLKPDADSDWIATGIANAFIDKLMGAPGVLVLERMHLKQVLDEQDWQRSSLVDRSTVVKLGKLAGAQRILTGSYAIQDDKIHVYLHLVDVQDGTIRFTRNLQFVSKRMAQELAASAETMLADSEFLNAVALGEHAHKLTDKDRIRIRRLGTSVPDAWMFSAQASQASDPEEKIKLLTQAIKADPKYAWAFNNRASAYAKLGQTGKALGDIAAAIRLDPSQGVFRSNRAQLYVRLGRDDDAARDLDTAIALRPGDWTLLYNRGCLWLRRGEAEKALSDFHKALLIHPDDPDCLINKAVSLLRLGRLGLAERSFRKALRIQPAHARGRCGLASLLAERGKTAEAFGLYGAVIRSEPNMVEAYLGRAQLYLAGKQARLALRDLNRAIQLLPQSPHAYQLRAQTFQMLGEPEAAKRDTLKALQLQKDGPAI